MLILLINHKLSLSISPNTFCCVIITDNMMHYTSYSYFHCELLRYFYFNFIKNVLFLHLLSPLNPVLEFFWGMFFSPIIFMLKVSWLEWILPCQKSELPLCHGTSCCRHNFVKTAIWHTKQTQLFIFLTSFNFFFFFQIRPLTGREGGKKKRVFWSFSLISKLNKIIFLPRQKYNLLDKFLFDYSKKFPNLPKFS